MYKLVILIEASENHASIDETWPDFLHLAESMPGLIREATARVETMLFGKFNVSLMHELFFESLQAVNIAMSSPQGSQAGKQLQAMTGGKVTLFLASHKEDDIAKIRQFRAGM
jgi:uncharacterized protein (TIGR02118 family)